MEHPPRSKLRRAAGTRGGGIRPQLVIFDCDGILVYSEVISNTVLALLPNAEGLSATFDPSESLALR